jgi:uncharacterized membrane protein YhaH (DUF805 family)
MEQNQTQIPTVVPQPTQMPTTVAEPHFINEKPKPGYFIRLFTGRMNRQNYIVGSTFFVLVPLICFIIVIFNILLSPNAFAMPSLDPTNPSVIVTPHISLASLLETPNNELWTVIGIVFIILSIPYLFSLQIKRLHDLNLTGWLWTLNFVPLISLCMFMPGISILNPPMWVTIANVVASLASFFSVYISVWPGTKGPNKYGEPPLPRSSFLGDIMQLR